jgi:UDP-glucose 4-epimerase
VRVLVTGGAGYIGSVVVEELLADGAEVVVLDDLSKGHAAAVPEGVPLVRADIGDRRRVTETCRKHGVEAAVHMAAFSMVGESVEHPARYYANNLAGSLALLDALREAGVRRFVLSSTAAVYGEPAVVPIDEDAPTVPTNPYGETKLALEKALHWYERAYGLRYASLRYFNAAGATERSGEDHHPETHLVPLVLAAAAGERPGVDVYGDDYPTPDGTCIRDYIHVSDLARAHVLALAALADARGAVFNLGCGGGYSVREVIAVAEQVTGRPVPARRAPRRPGDPAVLVASSDRIRRTLGWEPRKQDLRVIVEDAWRWRQRHPRGYAGTLSTAGAG